jgi:hypothetical protein
MEAKQTFAESSAVKSDDDEQEFVPNKVTSSNYRSLLDSDTDEDEIQKSNSSTIFKTQNNSDSDSDGEKIVDTPSSKSRIIAQSSDSSSSDHEETKPSPEKPVKDRRKNQNPKKKILPVKAQRVSYPSKSEILTTQCSHSFRNPHRKLWKSFKKR